MISYPSLDRQVGELVTVKTWQNQTEWTPVLCKIISVTQPFQFGTSWVGGFYIVHPENRPSDCAWMIHPIDIAT